jgi:uncharacterized phage protein gp47/JayE
MTYTPKPAIEILRDLTAMIVGRTQLTDISNSSIITTVLSSIAQELASVERKLVSIRESYFLDTVSGIDLDERVRELPQGTISRHQASHASGAVLQLTREDTTTELIIPAGSEVVCSRTSMTYRTIGDYTMIEGVALLNNIFIVASQSGSSGNCGIGEIDTIKSLPDQILTCTNTQALNNGFDLEDDSSLRARAKTYINSLSRSQRSALEFLAVSFVGSTGERLRYARLVEPETRPAYSELFVDDGTAEMSVQNRSRIGKVVGGIVPVGGQRVLYHEAPATAPITASQIRINGQVIAQNRIVSLHERGIVYVQGLQAGDTWTIGESSPYRVYTGIIAELQKEIEGDFSAPTRMTGFRAAGTRVVVKAITPTLISLIVNLKIKPYYAASSVQTAVVQTLISYINSLAPMDTLYISQLVNQCIDIDGVLDIAFVNSQGQPLSNIEPQSSSPTRIKKDQITIRIGA